MLNIFQENYQADVLGFGEAIHRANPTEWRKIKDDWQTIYPEVEVNVKVNVYTRG